MKKISFCNPLKMGLLSAEKTVFHLKAFNFSFKFLNMMRLLYYIFLWYFMVSGSSRAY